MLNINNLMYIYLNSVLYLSSFLFTKLPEAYAFLNPITDIMPVMPILYFLLVFVLLALQ